jgi:hypothetical protein
MHKHMNKKESPLSLPTSRRDHKKNKKESKRSTGVVDSRSAGLSLLALPNAAKSGRASTSVLEASRVLNHVCR